MDHTKFGLKTIVTLLLLILFAINNCLQAQSKTQYTEDRALLAAHNQASEWFPFYTYLENNNIRKHQEEKFGNPSEFNYHDFIPDFTSEKFDVGPFAQYHDGFVVWNSKVNPWNAASHGPGQDVTGELANSNFNV